MNGTKNLSQMIKNNFSYLFLLIAVMCFISDFLLNDAVLYLIGGIISATAKMLNAKNSVFYIWSFTLILFVIVYFVSSNRILDNFIIVFIAFLLYLFDYTLYNILPAIINQTDRYIHIGIGVFLKSIVLFLLVYYKNKTFYKFN